MDVVTHPIWRKQTMFIPVVVGVIVAQRCRRRAPWNSQTFVLRVFVLSVISVVIENLKLHY